VTKVLQSKINPGSKGIFLTQNIAEKEAFGFCAGTTWGKGDPRAKGDPLFFINVPGKNTFVDCTKTKFGKCHQMVQSKGSTAKATIEDAGHYLIFRANASYPAGEEMTFINFA
jgi:hypothetical protein